MIIEIIFGSFCFICGIIFGIIMVNYYVRTKGYIDILAIPDYINFAEFSDLSEADENENINSPGSD